VIVYGSLQSEASLHSVVGKLRNRGNPGTVDDWRALLIEAGQLEQAIVDRQAVNAGASHLIGQVVQLTDQAAAGFFACWFGLTEGSGLRESIWTSLRQLQNAENLPISIRIPEGYAFYGLFPEQYCAATLAWVKDHARQPKKCTVIGIRTIGTSLSAVVAATLRSTGRPAERLTVRPFGPPFRRQVKLSLSDDQKAGDFLVVDEGPGISGSSMVAVAKLLVEHGVRDIAFLPGHAGAPGTEASEEIRECWRSTPRYQNSLEEVHWKEGSLLQSLQIQTEKLLNTPGPFFVTDFSGGLWRRHVYTDEQHWPAVIAQFERMKFLCTDGHGNSLLWKFAGLADLNDRNSPDAVLSRLRRLAELGFTATPLGSIHGFVATPWIEGRRLTPSEAEDPQVLRHLARYLLASATDPLSAAEHRAGIARLREMLYCNTRESLGPDLAEQARSIADGWEVKKNLRCYGDGHLAPHEWVRNESGVILKTDCEGHDADHTIIGQQSALWDVAGILVEWHLEDCDAEFLLGLLEPGGLDAHNGPLRFYSAAYSAFRLGLFTQAGSQTVDAAEQERLQQARKFYERQLRRSLVGSERSGRQTMPIRDVQARYGANS
jgi:hypothetical protein